MSENMEWKCLSFNELTTDLLYKIMKVRQEVFIIEQDCNYLDCDDNDRLSEHLMIFIDGEIAAYARLLPPGVVYEQSSIGRVLTTKPNRGKGFGIQLMQRAIEKLTSAYPQTGICISAQLYLEKFYSDLGFQSKGESYFEDDIPHIKMIRYTKP